MMMYANEANRGSRAHLVGMEIHLALCIFSVWDLICI
jgi:hypothetical protein